MSSSVESRIVSMKFDNKDFERGVSTTLRSIGTLSKTLDAGFTSKATSGLSRIGSAIKGFSFGGMGASIQGISGKFIALGSIAATALARITNSAITAGISFFKQFTGLNAMKSGFSEYETQMSSIQTILANTGLEGQKGLDKVNAKLKELNTYSDKTIYNFSEMARNIGTFTAAGVDLDTSVTSIKGIANIAALSGSNAQQASTAMYQLSQAIAAGKVGLQDWNSVVNAGMGGKIFQEALINTAVAMGSIEESAISVDKATGKMLINGQTFRESIMAAPGKESWLSSGVLTGTLSQFSGDLDKAQLKAQGFTDAQIVDIQKQAKAAQDAATKVKTFTQLISTLQEAVGSGWAQTFGIVIGDFGEAKKLFTGLSNYIGGFIGKQAQARNKMLQDWKDLGGRDDLLEGFSNIWRGILRVIRPIHRAFREIFPKTTGEQLAKITEGFRKLTEGLLFSKKHSHQIHHIFKAIFTVFKIGLGVVGALIKYVAQFFGIIITGGGGDAFGAILGLVAKFAELVSWLGSFLLEGDRMGKFFDMLIKARNSVLEPIVGTIGAIVEALVSLVSGDVTGFFDHLDDAGNSLLDLFGVVGDKIGSFIQNVSQFFAELGSGGSDAISNVADKIAEFVNNMAEFFSNLGSGGFDAIAGVFSSIGDAIDNVKDKLNFGGAGVSVDAGPLSAVGDGLDKLSWIATAFSKVWDTLGTVFSFVGRTFAAVAPRLWKTLGIVGDKFLTFVENMDLHDLIAIINTGVFVMLYRSFTHLADSAGGLLGVGDAAKQAFGQLEGTLKSMQTAIRAQLIMSIAIAVALLSASLIALSLVPADKLKSAGAAIAGMITGLVAAFKVLGAGGGKKELANGEIMGEDLQLGMLSMAAAMIAFAGAILILSAAMLILEHTDWESFGKLAAMMALMVGAMLLLGKAGPGLAAGGAGMVGMAVAMTAMAVALKAMELVKWESIGKMAVVLLEMTAALVGLGLVGPAVLAGAGALLIVAPAISMITVALLLMAKIKWNAIWKLALTLGVLAIGLTAMIAALPGAIALGVLAAGLTILMPVLTTLGEMDFKVFLKSIGLLVTTMVVLGVTAAALGGMSPLIFAFGLALTAVGVALVLVGVGVFAFASGMAILAASGAAGFAVLLAAVTSFLAIFPQWVLQFKDTIDAFIYVLEKSGPPFIKVMGDLLRDLLNEIAKSAPDYADALEELIEAGLKVIRNTSDDWVDTAMKLIDDFLHGVDKNMDDIADKGAAIIIKFLKGIERNDDKIARQGVATIISLSIAMGRAIWGVIGWLWKQAYEIGTHIVGGILGGLQDLWHFVTDWVNEQIHKIPETIRNIMHISSPSKVMRVIGQFITMGLALGIRDNGKMVDAETTTVAQNAKNAMHNALRTLGEVSAEKMQFDPTIRPVLDLSEIETGAERIAGLLAPAALNAGVSAAGAQNLAATLATQNGQNGSDSAKSGGDTTFIQNNYSPKAISPVETYRGTNNLISLKLRRLNKTDETD